MQASVLKAVLIGGGLLALIAFVIFMNSQANTSYESSYLRPNGTESSLLGPSDGGPGAASIYETPSQTTVTVNRGVARLSNGERSVAVENATRKPVVKTVVVKPYAELEEREIEYNDDGTIKEIEYDYDKHRVRHALKRIGRLFD
jgi:hypothetical protein